MNGFYFPASEKCNLMQLLWNSWFVWTSCSRISSSKIPQIDRKFPKISETASWRSSTDLLQCSLFLIYFYPLCHEHFFQDFIAIVSHVPKLGCKMCLKAGGTRARKLFKGTLSHLSQFWTNESHLKMMKNAFILH